MSEATAFNHQEQLARINRAIAETQRFQQEANKLVEESYKRDAEERALLAQQDKWRWVWQSAVMVLAAAVGGVLSTEILGQLCR